MVIRWACSATRHRISRDRSRHVVESANVIFSQPSPPGSPLEDDRIVFLGADADGVLLEVMAVEINDGMLVIHAMEMRRKYLPYLEGEKP
jgi:hypothetical protein